MLSISRPVLVSRITAVGLACFLVPVVAGAADAANTLTRMERSQGFALLFDGRSLSGWQHKGNWKVIKGVISRSGRGGSLVLSLIPI